MLSDKLSSEQSEIIKKFKNKYALDTNEENILPIIHLMCKHKIDKDTALDQTSRGGEDFGIDAWFYDKKK